MLAPSWWKSRRPIVIYYQLCPPIPVFNGVTWASPGSKTWPGTRHKGNATKATPWGHQRHEGNATKATPWGHLRHEGNATKATPRGHQPGRPPRLSQPHGAWGASPGSWVVATPQRQRHGGHQRHEGNQEGHHGFHGITDGHTYNPVLTGNRWFSIANLERKFSSSNEDKTPDTYVYSAKWASDCAKL
jgi:hypothetical protein